MALFKSRKAGEDAAGARQSESIETMRKRARHRLIGAGVLVLIGVLGFPLLFDTQPRPIAVDIPIDIPDRDKVKPLQPPKPMAPAPEQSAALAPAAPVAAKPAVVPASAAARVDQNAGPAALPESKVAPVTTAKAEVKPEPKLEAKPSPKPEPSAEAKPVAKAEPRAAEAVKSKAAPEAKAAVEGKSVAAASSEARYVVQVGAFADPARAREARAKVERAGLKTYTHVAETKNGKRIRVRVGPFETRGEADKAASKIKGLDMPAAILTL